MQNNIGDHSHLPSSSNYGIPTAFDLSNWQVPQGLIVLILAAIAFMIIMHLVR